MRLPNGSFTQLADTLAILGETCKDNTDGLDEDEKEQKLMLSDNSKSALAKITMFQYDNNNLVKDELCQTLYSTMLPLTNDFDEAQDIHGIILK